MQTHKLTLTLAVALIALASVAGCQHTAWLRLSGEGSLYVWIERSNVRLPEEQSLTQTQTRSLASAMLAELLGDPMPANAGRSIALPVTPATTAPPARLPRPLGSDERTILADALYNRRHTFDPRTSAPPANLTGKD